MPPEQAAQTQAPNPANALVEEYNEFSTVFDDLIDKGEAPNEETTTTGQTDGSDLPANDAEQPPEPTDGTGDPSQSAEAGENGTVSDGQGAQDAPGGEPAGGGEGAQDVDWAAKYAELEQRLNDLQKAPQTAATAPQQAEPAAAPTSVYTPEETTELADLAREWPDVHRIFTLMARQLQVDTLNYAFSEVGKVIAPLQETVGTYTTNDHMSAIYEAHEDYDQVYHPVVEWIETQPSFLKTAYQNVFKQGTAEEVSMMIQRFKDETKWAAPAATTGKPATPAAAASTPTQQQTGLSPAAKQAAKAMGAVGAKRGAGASAQDPNDFDGAWEEAVSTK